MPIVLQDAIERAEVMAGQSGDLKQESYALLSSQLEEKDVYPFTVALVERNINVRTGSASDADIASMEDLVYENEESEEEPGVDIVERLARAAQTMRQREPGGLWMPEEYTQDEDIPIYTETDEGEEEVLEEITEEDIEWEGTTEEYETLQEVETLKEELESLGISITPDGLVSFYQSNIPGLYTEKNPLKPMDLEKAFKYYDQSMGSVDREQTRVNELQDLLSRLTRATGEVEFALEDLDAFKYSPESRSTEIQDIAYGIEEVKTGISSGDWNIVQQSLDNLQGLLESYSGVQYTKYEQALSTMEVLDRLIDIQEYEPEKYQQIAEGLGALPRAAGVNMGDYQAEVRLSMSFVEGILLKVVEDHFPDLSSEVEEIMNDFMTWMGREESGVFVLDENAFPGIYSQAADELRVDIGDEYEPSLGFDVVIDFNASVDIQGGVSGGGGSGGPDTWESEEELSSNQETAILAVAEEELSREFKETLEEQE